METNSITEIDVIFLSFAFTDQLQQMAQDSIQSLVISEDNAKIKFNIIVLEVYDQLNNYECPFTTTIYPGDPAGPQRYFNIGISMTTSAYVCLCHANLIFHRNWASEILKYMKDIPDLLSASPVCSSSDHHQKVSGDHEIVSGYRVGYEIAEWCLFIRRDLFGIIGQLDENMEFNASAYDYSNTLAVLGINHSLIRSSIVDHLEIENSNAIKDGVELHQTFSYYNYKWGHRILSQNL